VENSDHYSEFFEQICEYALWVIFKNQIISEMHQISNEVIIRFIYCTKNGYDYDYCSDDVYFSYFDFEEKENEEGIRKMMCNSKYEKY
jgi:hypothetical protein